MERKIRDVALYVRKSRDNSESLEGQISSLIDYCERFNWEYQLFKEEGSASSEDWNRPELQRMIKLIEKQHFDAIVVTEQSRITRSDEFPKFRNILQETNCLFITTQTNSVYDYNKPEDEFVSDIMSAVAKQEIAFAKLRLKRGTIQSAKKGNYMGKKVVVGYNYNRETKRLEPSEDASVIRRMFEEYANGLSTTDIAYKFTTENVTTSTGMIWTPSGISRLLNNIVFNGHSLYGKTTQKKDKSTGRRITKKTSKDEQILIKNTHEAIIDDELWNKVQQLKLERNSRPIAIRLGKHKFSSLIICGLCGRTHSFQNSRYKRFRVTSCQTRHYDELMKNYTICKNEGCNITEFENKFYPQLEQYVEELKKYIEIIKASEDKKNTDYKGIIKSKERQIKKLEQDKKRIQQGYIMKIFDEEEAQEETKKIKQQIIMLKDEIHNLEEKDGNVNINYLESVLKKIKLFLAGKYKMSEHKENEILKEVVEAILYIKTEHTDHKVELKIVWKDII